MDLSTCSLHSFPDFLTMRLDSAELLSMRKVRSHRGYSGLTACCTEARFSNCRRQAFTLGIWSKNPKIVDLLEACD